MQPLSMQPLSIRAPSIQALFRSARAAALVLALGLAAHANDYVKLKNGTPIKGEATSYDEATNSLNFKLEDGTTRTFKMDELDGRSVYLVNHSRVPKDDAVKQIRLANLARDVGLYAHAVRHYEYAAKADPSKKPEIEREVAVLKTKAATWAMQQVRSAQAKGDKAEAEKWLLKMVEKVPDTPEGKEAAAMLDQTYAAARAKREADAEAKADDKLKEDLQTGKKLYDNMVAKTQKGLTAKNSGGQAVNSFEGAANDGERVLKELDKVTKKYPDATTQATLAGYRKIVVDQLIETRLHLASVLTVRSSYNDALSQVNQALALDPKNEQAQAARVRVEQAAAERGGWVW
jgi:tetratricopeptide (TPR) repeat protein